MATRGTVDRGRGWALYLGLALAGVAFCAVLAARSPTAWDVDFNQFYSAGKLVGTGRLYDWDAIRRLELQHRATAVPFGRIPFFAFVFQLFSALPYGVARGLWFGVEVAALAGFALLWPMAGRARMAVAICWSVPALMCLTFGQDSVLFLFFVALGMALLEDHEFLAGVALSGCIAKPHLALLLPVLLAARGKWKALAGGLAGGLTALLISLLVEGKEWPLRLLALARAPEFDPAADRMPTLKGMLSLTGGGVAVQIAVTLGVVAACWYLSSRLPLPAAAALALAGGLLISKTELPGHLAVTGYTLALFAAEVLRTRRKAPVVSPA